MWTTILGFISPYITKYLLPVLGGICAILVAICIFLYSSNKGLTSELADAKSKLTTLVQVSEEERTKARSMIEEQNNQISAYKIDLAEYTRVVNEKEKALMEARVIQQQQVDKELSIDSSSDNQLKIMVRVMKEFANETR